MEDAGEPGLLAEVAIAVTGFAGVIAALRSKGGRITGCTAVRTGIILGGGASIVLQALTGA